MKAVKTNVMRILEQHKIVYGSYIYGDGITAVSGMEVAEILGKDPLTVFKTLVTVGKSGQHYVFVIPCCFELDLKKAAESVDEKNIEMIKSKELLGLTGYIHGGCSPIGMKKFFPTVVDVSARDYPAILFSGGHIGCQVETAPADLEKVIPVKYADIIE